MRELQELRNSLEEKEFALLQKQQELEEKERTMVVLQEQVGTMMVALSPSLSDSLFQFSCHSEDGRDGSHTLPLLACDAASSGLG